MTMTETTSQDSALGWGWRMGVLFILSYVVRVRLSSRARRWSTQSEPLPVLARPFDVGHAAPAQLRMRGIVADVGTVMPAAHALGLLRWTCDHKIGKASRREKVCQYR